MSKKIKIGDAEVEVPDNYDSTTHDVRKNDDGTYTVTEKTKNNATDAASKDDKAKDGNETTENSTDTEASKTSSKTQQTLTDKDKLKGSGNYLNMLYSHTDQDENDLISTNSGKYKISIFFTPKFITSSDIFTTQQCLFLKFNDTVESLVLEDDIERIGMKGYIDVINKSSILDTFLGRHNNYYVVINITQYADNFASIFGKQQVLVKYEPYIFDVDYVQNLSNPQKEQKKLRIGLVDIATSILKTHSIVSVIKFDKSITKSNSYKEVFKKILDYIKNYIKINTNNKYQYKKDLLYDETVKCLGNANDGYDKDAGMSALVAASFEKIPRDATVLEAMQVLIRDCCTTLKAPKSFTDEFMSIGDVLIPFFFKEQYPDPFFIYPTMWQRQESKAPATSTQKDAPAAPAAKTQPAKEVKAGTAEQSAQTVPVQTKPSNPENTPAPADNAQPAQPAANNAQNAAGQSGQTTGTAENTERTLASKLTGFQNAINQLPIMKNNSMKNNIQFYWSGYKGKGGKLLCRQMTMRNIFMPFFLAFGNKKYSSLMEDINPSRDNLDQNDEIPFLGVYHGQLKALTFHPIDINSVKKLWKNMVFLDCTGEAIGSNSTLIFFSWFFDFFQRVFLNSDNTGLVSNVMPDFFLLSRSQGIKHATKDGNKFENLFDQYNSNTYSTVTQDSVSECLRVMGKNLASFTLINDSFTFTMNGNMLRRPNEIVRFGYKDSTSGGFMQMLSANVGIHFGEHTFLYIRKVIHRFTGSTYNNDVYGYKICELLKPIV